MIFSGNINLIDSKCVNYPDIKKSTTETNKNTGFAGYLATCVSSAKSDAPPGLYENTTKNDNIGDWKYLSVQAGEKVYTYMLIGKHFKVLIGIDNAEKEEEVGGQGEKTVDAKNAGDTKETGGFEKNADFINFNEPSNEPSLDKQNKFEKQMPEPDFITDTRMFALLGGYQEKMRQAMKKMQENLGDVKPAGTKEIV